MIYVHLQEYISAYMFLSLVLLLFTGLPVTFVLGGVSLFFGLAGIYLDITSFIEFYLFVERIWQGAIANPILVAVPCFIFMGTMLEKSDVANDLLDILQILLNRVPGGMALAVILLGTIMAATTGIIGASVVMMTAMALPKMLNERYNPSLASGTLASSATLGILIPPSIMLVIMADLLSVSVGNLFLGALIPGLILSLLYILYVVCLCAFRPDLAPAIREEARKVGPSELPKLLLRGFLPPVFLIFLVLGSIFAGWATPTEAGGIGAFGAILLAVLNSKLSWSTLQQVCNRTAITSAMIFGIFLGATAFSYMFRALYGEDLIVEFLEWLELGPWGFLIAILVLVFVLGFFFDWIEITLIVLPVFGPVILEYSSAFIEHVGAASLPISKAENQVIYWFAILVAINLQTSFLTPPFGFALFYMKGAAGKIITLRQIYVGIIPFVGLQLLGLLLVVFWPEISLWLPTKMLN